MLLMAVETVTVVAGLSRSRFRFFGGLKWSSMSKDATEGAEDREESSLSSSPSAIGCMPFNGSIDDVAGNALFNVTEERV